VPEPAPSSPKTLGIGQRLRAAREARGLSVAAVSSQTRIRAAYLQALEDEQFDRLPGGVYARGYLRAYARALGLDPDELLATSPHLFSGPAPPLVGPVQADVPIRPARRPSPLRRVVLTVLVIVTATAGVLGYIGYQQLRQFQAPVPLPDDQRAEPASPPPAPAPAPPPPPATVPPPRGPVVEVVGTGVSWLRVVADGEQVFAGFVRAGDRRVWAAQRTLTVRVGNAPAVTVLLHGRPVQPPPGRRVWEQTFTAEQR
jgi:cytoskeletal protein RodZ